MLYELSEQIVVVWKENYKAHRREPSDD